MVRVTSIRNIKEQLFDETWLIVRSMKSVVRNAIQVQELSPSLNLFFEYQRLTKLGRWNETAFEQVYVPEFINGLVHDATAIDRLNELAAKSKAGKNICIACFCPNEAMCHRSIIAGLLQGANIDVKTDSGLDFSKYYIMYKNAYKAKMAANQ